MSLLVTAVCVVAVTGVVAGSAVAAPRSAAEAQYVRTPPLKTGSGVKGASAGQGSSPGSTTVQSGGLPFTGLSLAAPIGFALLMVVVGIGLRRAFRPRSPRS